MLNIKLISAVVFCSVIAILIIRWAMPFARSLSLEDIPAGRKQHRTPTPVVGGIGVVFGFWLTLIFWGYFSYVVPAFWVASLFLFLVGLLDDMHEFGSKPKFVAQGIAALMMAMWGQVCLVDLGNLFGAGDIVLGAYGLPMTVIGVVGVVNAINMIDGVDGLSGSISLVSAFAFASAAMFSGRVDDGVVLLCLCGAIVGFLCLNARFPGRKNALVFLGDAGALFVGFILAWYAVKLSSPQIRVISPAAVLWLLALPLFDTITVMSRRILDKRSPFSADRTHIHHILIDAGLPIEKIVPILFAFASFLAGLGVLASVILGVPEHVLFGGFVLLFLLYVIATRCLIASNRDRQTLF
jgi:UDP-GlcNAc:undecaprenyl-phosphate GlcNAc-1-phosphate transferase